MLCSQKDIEKCLIGAADGDIGQVKDLYFDDQSWAIRYLIFDTGSWLSERKVLISPISINRLDWSEHRLQVAITGGQVERSPSIDINKPVSRQHEMQYLSYYGNQIYLGGARMWGSGMISMGLYPGGAELPSDIAAREPATEENATAERDRHRHNDPHLRSCQAVLGYNIVATDGEVRHVDGFGNDDQTRAIRYLVVNTSTWWIDHQVLVAPAQIGGVHWLDHSVTVELSRATIPAAPAYNASANLQRWGQMHRYWLVVRCLSANCLLKLLRRVSRGSRSRSCHSLKSRQRQVPA